MLAKSGFAGQTGLAGGAGFVDQTGFCWPSRVLLAKPGLLAAHGGDMHSIMMMHLLAGPGLLAKLAAAQGLLDKPGLAGQTGVLGKFLSSLVIRND